jgi:AhpD family alkylhydroperoxidase
MLTGRLIEYDEAGDDVRRIYDDIKQSRGVKDVNNFWKALANHPPTLVRTWESLKEVMAPGALDARTKEMLYLAVSITNGCEYCIRSHARGAAKQGMTAEMFAELAAVVGMANETNRLVNAWQVPVDAAFEGPLPL